jgi:citrate synthase
MLYETSKLDANEGIAYRGTKLFDIRDKAPRTVEGGEPIPEGMLWLFLTGEMPSDSEITEFKEELYRRGQLSAEEERLIKSLPKDMHAMTQFASGVLACQPSSNFVKAYQSGVHKTKYWEATFEDCIDVCAKVSRIAAIIYQNKYGDVNAIPDRDPSLDYSANFANQLGFNDSQFWELMRLYLTIHADHEGGNVSAHACHLVGSALSDPYLSFAAGMTGLAGPLHGLANQECLNYLLKFKERYGENWTREDIRQFVDDTFAAGKVIPGYGHGVLRKTDPRFLLQLEYAAKHIKNDNLVELVKANYEEIPKKLAATGKIKNPWPNVDCGSGALLMHYGLTQHDYYTVLFGVSRSFGVMPAQVWSRALGLPIERPNSFDLENLRTLAESKK